MTNKPMNFSFFKFDWKLLLPVIILLFLSLTTLVSINASIFRSQLIFVIVGIIVFVAFAQVNYKFLENLSLPIYIVSLVLLVVVLLIGSQSRGAVRWFAIGGLGIQFSEVLKPFLALALASFLTAKKNLRGKTALTVFLFVLPIAFLIYRQPDLGNALIYLAVVALTLLFYGFALKWFIGGFAVLFASIPLVWQVLHQYQRERLLTFFHLTNDPLGISYNAIQSVIAVGSGMLLGKGLGQGTQSGLRFLPERHTDFIFATTSEELGFIGGAILVITFCFLLYRMYVLLCETDDLFIKIFLAITFSLFLIQFFVNIGMNIGIMPIVGVTLPFVSYGGSSLLSNMIFLGIVSSMTRLDRRKNVLEIG